MTATVAIGGLGAIGYAVAAALDAGAIAGMRLAAVSASDPARARARTADFRNPPELVDLAGLAAADIVVEAAPAAVFADIATPAIAAGRVLIACSAGALLPRLDIIAAAERSGGRIVVPTGALLGLDAVRAAAEGRVDSVTLETRKPPAGLAGAPWLEARGMDMARVREPTCVFDGNAGEAAAGFPANANVAAALALAGIGAERTRVTIWADPTVTRNTHTIRVEAEAARFTMTIEGVPSAANPRTGRLTPLSVIACLRGQAAALKIGS